MKKFALIGKSISHSKSPEMYKKILTIKHEYHLLDFQSEDQIPSLEQLAKIYSGINITSPYKKYFLDKVELSVHVKQCESLNCLKNINGNWLAENTDYLAIKDLLNQRFSNYLKQAVVILGDGVMSGVVLSALNVLGVKAFQLSRKKTDSFAQVKIKNFRESPETPLLIINTCSRDFVFNGEMPNNALFWDLNYAFQPHLAHKSFTNLNYVDGEELLFLQAKYASLFWSDILIS